MNGSITPQAFRDTLSHYPSGVTVMATAVDGLLHGMTASSFTSLSLDPLRILVCVAHRTGLHALVLRSRTFALTFLTEDQEAASRWFASPQRAGGAAQFRDHPWRPAPVTGSPVLVDGSAFVDCRLADVHRQGDHSIFVGAVVALGELTGHDRPPLIHYRRDYRQLRAAEAAT